MMRRLLLCHQVAARNVACQRRPCAKTRAPRWATFRPSGVLAVGAHRSTTTDTFLKCCRETTRGLRQPGGAEPRHTAPNQRRQLYPTQKETRRAAGFFLTSPGGEVESLGGALKATLRSVSSCG